VLSLDCAMKKILVGDESGGSLVETRGGRAQQESRITRMYLKSSPGLWIVATYRCMAMPLLAVLLVTVRGGSGGGGGAALYS
jgi:hypothetical protein